MVWFGGVVVVDEVLDGAAGTVLPFVFAAGTPVSVRTAFGLAADDPCNAPAVGGGVGTVAFPGSCIPGLFCAALEWSSRYTEYCVLGRTIFTLIA